MVSATMVWSSLMSADQALTALMIHTGLQIIVSFPVKETVSKENFRRFVGR